METATITTWNPFLTKVNKKLNEKKFGMVGQSTRSSCLLFEGCFDPHKVMKVIRLLHRHKLLDLADSFVKICDLTPLAQSYIEPLAGFGRENQIKVQIAAHFPIKWAALNNCQTQLYSKSINDSSYLVFFFLVVLLNICVCVWCAYLYPCAGFCE